jgi:metal-sulfur cluster biosynthetic enzyme
MTETEKKVPQWAADQGYPELCARIRETLRQVRDPELGMDLIQLGLVRNVTIADNKISIDMILTTPYCPYAPMLMESARQKVEEATSMTTEVAYGKELWDPSMMEDGTTFSWGLF